MRRLGALLLPTALLAGLAWISGTRAKPDPVAPVEATTRVDFGRDVLPILSTKCYSCHGPDSQARKAGLRLDARAAALQPARSGAIAIHPGQPGESELIRRIDSEEETERMPPVTAHKDLTAGEKATLRRWIEQGAEYGLPWAFVKPTRPSLPPVHDTTWPRNEIDAFILARLERAKLQPSPEADRATLIRRLSLDLRGLPPTLHEVDAFLADPAPDAYEKLVDQFLESPHYGEKMAQRWLDLARFGDTSGFHQDSTRQMWLWRDGVIAAFNANMPFDRFTIEQLAGDLLPKATTAQKIASGFNRNTRFNEEGGVDPEEFVIRYHVDRTNTVGQVWLGLTVACAECHDHKSDPISQKEFYQLYAFFTGIREPMVSMNHNQPLPPLLHVPTPEQERALAEARKELAAVDAALAGELKAAKYHDPLEGQPDADPERFRESQRAWERRAPDMLPDDVVAALARPAAERSTEERQRLRAYYLHHVHGPLRDVFEPLDREREQLQKSIKATEAQVPTTLICEEAPDLRPTHILLRGDFLHKGPRVDRDVPAVLPPFPAEAPRNRLGLARWLVSPENPLTARVTVNRHWAQMFGAGLVRTPGDFGSQGDVPSHPELLDWLATDFTRLGWDVKALLRKLAISQTYRQVSTYRPSVSDPDNRLLARAPRFRLTAEEIRDGALCASGLLSRKIGGPSVMPYQPADYYRGKFEAWPWLVSAGEEQYRRGLYTFWRRTSLHPMLTLFDAPTREECCVARARTNTPTQALVTLNDPTFVEAARVFAERILIEGPADLDGRLVFAFRTALTRSPEAAELEALRRRHGQLHERFERDREAAAKFIDIGMAPRPAQLDVVEHATWMGIAGLLLNLDEMITRQ